MGWTARNIPSFPFTLAIPPDEITLENEADGAAMRYVPERTCRVVSTIRYDWEGGYAGTEYETELSCGHKYTDDYGNPPNYCPDCGARNEDAE